MTLEELRLKISKSRQAEDLNSLELNLNFKDINFVLNLKSITAIYEFVSNQYNGWNKKQENLPEELTVSKNAFETTKNKIIEFTKPDYITSLSYDWKPIALILENNYKHYFTHECAEVDFLIKVHNEFPDSFLGAYRFIIDDIQSGINKKELLGMIQAYEFVLKDSSNILDRRNSEKGSIGRIRNDFYKYLTTSETEIADFIARTGEKYKEYTMMVDEFKEEKKTAFDKWFNESLESTDKFNQDSTKKIEDLEKAYEALLSLKKPADYWNKRATLLKMEGQGFLKWLVGLVLFGCTTLYLLLWLTPEGMLLSFIKGQASAIKWSIVYVTFISLLAFGIKAISKVMFSSFHLARDAEEREQLTYVYLAMIKEAAIDEKDRSLIMQSLFSRSDTGLLKEDSSPTMPGGIVDKIIQR